MHLQVKRKTYVMAIEKFSVDDQEYVVEVAKEQVSRWVKEQRQKQAIAQKRVQTRAKASAKSGNATRLRLRRLLPHKGQGRIGRGGCWTIA